jgi:hypothetical protein
MPNRGGKPYPWKGGVRLHDNIFLSEGTFGLREKKKPLGGVTMPSFVMTEKCDGCKGQDKTACMYICPNDLMTLDKERMKGYNQEPQYCWECYC